ncbi:MULTISPECIES: PulJ/GspJ family protein [unclassified Pseudoalteromonas]|uniref:PulJ/GspJ family protein n=1 Tax=unclassified Pseudoalteromonas TaxID=194690 RepID=UPI00390C7472
MSNNKQAGFTLIEVLVASVILFATITLVSDMFRGAFISSERANRHVTISGIMPIALKQIQAALRHQSKNAEHNLSGSNVFWGVSVSWQAQKVAFKSAPPLYDYDLGKYQQVPNKYSLWQVSAEFSYGETTTEYSYYEVSWNES